MSLPRSARLGWDQMPARLDSAYLHGLLSLRWTLDSQTDQPVFRAAVPMGQRVADLQVTHGDGWTATCRLHLTGGSDLLFDSAIHGVQDYMEALAVAEQWAREELKA